MESNKTKAIVAKKTGMEICCNPPDGKERRRERKRLERLQKKRRAR